MTNTPFADPNDLLWSDGLVSIVNKEVRRVLRVPMDELSPHDARLVGAHPRSFRDDESSRLRTYVKLAYALTLPASKERSFDMIMTDELEYNRVPFKTDAPDDIANWEHKTVYRHGSPERFVQIDAYFVPDDAFEAQYADPTTNQTL